MPDWQVFHPQSGDFVQLLAKNSIYLLYNTELNFFVLAGWAGTAKKICKKRARIKKMTRAPTKRRIFAHPAHFSHFKE